MKKNIRFLKKIIILCLTANVFITLSTLFICIRANEISPGILTTLLGAWSIELALSAFIKGSESKKKVTESNEIID